MVSQITSLTIVYSAIYSGTDQSKQSELRFTGLCGGNSPVTGEFPAQRASNGEMFPFDDVIMLYYVIGYDASGASNISFQSVIRHNMYSLKKICVVIRLHLDHHKPTWN